MFQSSEMEILWHKQIILMNHTSYNSPIKYKNFWKEFMTPTFHLSREAAMNYNDFWTRWPDYVQNFY